MKYRLGDKEFTVKVAKSNVSRKIGLSQTKILKKNTGLILDYPKPVNYAIEMKNMAYPLDIIFLLDNKVIMVTSGDKEGKDVICKTDFDKVLEVNKGEASGLKLNTEGSYVGEKLPDGTFDYVKDKEPAGSAVILDSDGNAQGYIKGEERIYSRKHTARLVELAKTARKSELNSDYKALGKAMVKFVNKQDSQEIETVDE